MKKIIALCFLLQSVLCFSQPLKEYEAITGYLGQTKAYIIKVNELCRIQANSDVMLVLICDDNWYGFSFMFEPLCQSVILSLTETEKSSLVKTIFSKGGKKIKDDVILDYPKDIYKLNEFKYSLTLKRHLKPNEPTPYTLEIAEVK